MLTLLTLFVVFMVLVAFFFLVFGFVIREEDVYVEGVDRFNQKVRQRTASAAPAAWIAFKKNKPVLYSLLIVGLIFTFSHGIFFIAKPGTAYSLQYLWGGDEAITTQGLKLKLFGNPIPISFEIAFQDTIGRHEAQDEIYYRSAMLQELSGAVKARIAASIVVSINYLNKEQFLATADKNRSEGKLVFARIIPGYDQAIKNSCKLITAQEYIDGASAQFDFYLRDQLQHGMYLTEEVMLEDENQFITKIDSSSDRTVKGKANNLQKQRRYIIKKDSKGNIMRDTTNSLSRYGLTVQQAAVTYVDWETAFDNRLDKQKEKIAEIQLETQNAEKSFYETQAKIQAGEALKATRQKELEVAQIEQTMQAETAAKAAFFKKTEEQNLLDAARKTAERIKVEADAEFYKNSKLVSAGLTPQERAYWRYRSDSVLAAAVGNAKWPSVMVNSGGGTGSKASILEDLIGADYAKRVLSPDKN